MKTLSVTKQDIVQGLRTEPLAVDRWYTDDSSTCAVCAVGAALRTAGLATNQGNTFDNAARQITNCCYGAGDIAPLGNWLSALSIVWEHLNSSLDWSEPVESLRADILAWAEDNIPEGYMAKVQVGDAT